MAEAIMNLKGRPNFTAYSAGSHPSGAVRPEALRQLEAAHVPRNGLRSKSWDEFAKQDAPQLDFVFTVCDNAAKEVCPVWPGQPLTAHWGVADPAAVRDTPQEIERAYRDAFFILERRISLFLCLPLASIDRLALKRNRQHWTSLKCNLTARTVALPPGTSFPVAAVFSSGIRSDSRYMW